VTCASCRDWRKCPAHDGSVEDPAKIPVVDVSHYQNPERYARRAVSTVLVVEHPSFWTSEVVRKWN